MTDFEKLTQLHEDFASTWAAFNAARHDADDMIAAVGARLRLEQEQAAARAVDLEKTVRDSNRSETVRRVAGVELSRLRDRKFAATQDEVAAFAELIHQQESAILDLRKIQTDFREAFDEVGLRLKEIRADVLGHKSMPVAENWIAGQKKAFARLCEEVIE